METQVGSRNNRTDGEYSERGYGQPRANADSRLAASLGWFSVALGMAELLLPKAMSVLIGVNDERRRLLPLMGLREIASGASILFMRDAPGPVWSRVGGDAIDLAFLGSAFAARRSDKSRLMIAAVAVLGVAALDLLCAQNLARARAERQQRQHLFNDEQPFEHGY